MQELQIAYPKKFHNMDVELLTNLTSIIPGKIPKQLSMAISASLNRGLKLQKLNLSSVAKACSFILTHGLVEDKIEIMTIFKKNCQSSAQERRPSELDELEDVTKIVEQVMSFKEKKKKDQDSFDYWESAYKLLTLLIREVPAYCIQVFEKEKTLRIVTSFIKTIVEYSQISEESSKSYFKFLQKLFIYTEIT